MVTEHTIRLRLHASKRMLERGIPLADVLTVINEGVVIEHHSSDVVRPWGKALAHAIVNGRPLHVSYAMDPTGVAHVFTVYEADANRWMDEFTRRKS